MTKPPVDPSKELGAVANLLAPFLRNANGCATRLPLQLRMLAKYPESAALRSMIAINLKGLQAERNKETLKPT